MLISLCAKQFDLAGSCMLEVPEPDFGATARRVSRVATLDGNAVANDFGYSDADRTISLSWIPSAAEDETITRLIRYHDRVVVSTKTGVMECVIDSYSINAGRARLVILPLSRMSE